jgi:hypothetical protein
MTLSGTDLVVCLLAAGLCSFIAGWITCWAVAMRYGELTGRFRERMDRARRPHVALITIPSGVAAALAVPVEPDVNEEHELISTWAAHKVVTG